MTHSLDPVQIALWPELRSQLVNAARQPSSDELLIAFSGARLRGMGSFAKEDLGWQAEAFLLGETHESPPSWITLRADLFERAGLDWQALAPLVFDESVERLRHALRLPSRGAGSLEQPKIVLSALNLVFFLACVGVGPYPERAMSAHGASFRSACRGLSQLDRDRKAQAGAILSAFRDSPAPKSPMHLAPDHAGLFKMAFGESPWGEDCRRWGSETDFTREIDRLVEIGALESSAGPATASRPAPRI